MPGQQGEETVLLGPVACVGPAGDMGLLCPTHRSHLDLCPENGTPPQLPKPHVPAQQKPARETGWVGSTY